MKLKRLILKFRQLSSNWIRKLVKNNLSYCQGRNLLETDKNGKIEMKALPQANFGFFYCLKSKELEHCAWRFVWSFKISTFECSFPCLSALITLEAFLFDFHVPKVLLSTQIGFKESICLLPSLNYWVYRIRQWANWRDFHRQAANTSLLFAFFYGLIEWLFSDSPLSIGLN